MSSRIKWKNYYGSPSKKGCVKCLEWKRESKSFPNNFKKQIIYYIFEGENIILGSIKSTETRKNFDNIKKTEIEIKRKNNWYESIKNRTEEKKKDLYERYSYYSKMFQKQRYITIKHLDTNIIESDFIQNWEKRGYGRSGIVNRTETNSQKILFCRKIKKHIIVLSHTFISPHDLSQKM